MENGEICIWYSNKYYWVDGMKVKISRDILFDIMESEEFAYYCTKERKLKEGNITHYCISNSGKKISPRWVLEFIANNKSDWFEEKGEETLIRYGHTDSGRRIFEVLNIPILSR